MQATKIFNTFLLLLVVSFLAKGQSPVYSSGTSDATSLQKINAQFLTVSREKLLSWVPPQGGFYFSGSPLTEKGAQENNLEWEPELGNKVRCKFTGGLLPNDEYPENGFVEVKTPTGKKQRFNYYQDKKGKKYYFEGRRWYDQRVMMENAAYSLAQLYCADTVTYKEAGLRSAAILQRFAEVYPDYVIKYDHPGDEKRFIDDSTYQKAAKTVDHYFIRLTRWYWWGYADISRPLLQTYDQLKGTAVLPEAQDKAAVRMLDEMIEFVDHFEGLSLTNMHPYLWETQEIAAKVLKRPILEKKVLNGVNRLLKEQFTYDGFYKEATVSYSNQTVGGLKNVLKRFYPGIENTQFEEKIKTDYPDLYRTFQANLAFRLPNGRYACINDTWWGDKYEPIITESKPQLMPGMGHAVLGFGLGKDQLQAHLNYSGKYGHDHYGSLGLILFGKEKELASDIGYTHTRARTWTNSTAAHNTVVVDGISQKQGANPRNGMGNLLLYQTESPDFQVVEVEAPEVYPGKVTDYRRTLIAVQSGNGSQYVVDLFHVKGGERHDWILHGSADEPQKIEVHTTGGDKLDMQSKDNLLPEGFVFEELKEQGRYDLLGKKDWAFGHFKNVKQTTTPQDTKVTFRNEAEPDRGLDTWLMGAVNQKISTANSWNVRGADEDQGILDNYLRESVLVRRPGGASRFVAVHVPFKGTPSVKQVREFPLDENGTIVRIEHQTGIDFLVYQSVNQKKKLVVEGKQFEMNGRVALFRMEGKAIKKIGEIRPTEPSQLIAFDTNSVTVKGKLALKPGNVFRILHGDGHNTAFHVSEVQSRGDTTKLFTQEPVTLKDMAGGKLQLDSFPFPEFPGPHTVSSDLLLTK